jgi:hypothetical protein
MRIEVKTACLHHWALNRFEVLFGASTIVTQIFNRCIHVSELSLTSRSRLVFLNWTAELILSAKHQSLWCLI